MTSLLVQLVDLLQRDIDSAQRERACLHLLDWLACASFGETNPMAKKLQHYLASCTPFNADDHSNNLALAINGHQYYWQDALLYNAALGNLGEMDDVHRQSILHPGPVVIPAALAVAQRVNASPQALLDAIVIGYEATIRIGRALGADHYRFYHNTSTCGGFGAAAAAAYLLRLDKSQTVSALANAGTRTGGFWQMRHEPVDSKALHNAEAAKSGVNAALLAQAGVTGPASLLEGEQGFFAATSPQARPAMVTSEPEANWLINDCSFKPWPACRHVHATIDAVRALKLPFKQIKNIQHIQVHTYSDALRFCDCPVPTTERQAKFSLQHAVAVSLARETPALVDFSEHTLGDNTLAELRRLTKVAAVSDFDAVYPDHYGAEVSITFNDGQQSRARVGDAWGDPENPMSLEQVARKALTLLTAGGRRPENCPTIIQQTLALANSTNTDAWFKVVAECERNV